MLEQTASQSRDLPLFYCTMVTPSGHLPSEWLRPDILSLVGTWANYIALRNGGGDKPHSHCRTNCESLNGSPLHHNIGIGEDGQVKTPNEGQQLFQYLCHPSSNPSLRLGEGGGGGWESDMKPRFRAEMAKSLALVRPSATLLRKDSTSAVT